ncbi:MAG TPA: phosphoenolpyruvate carboxykinase (ATP) [Candidatus Thiothrix moscowensis]|uniref:phosphoenolpyruvate carboxykinase (ATP) n=1 Tax=unclassified Thiothrix TaxID=2636184 RepID=UPI001A324BB0|nr:MULTISPECIES: phosphoenolpyruvate carboxykinase (ATP) [unclassified Thiothrix]MBJ6611629.1 phosphoenolpyruvate carboxykinase (ATP) [Candidatus Thiothrix moscowensis]HRJ53737.1 phosphoenolpyruvate carboxykinase (ATP) [Candidatus Thiothrix moscowensis]HRJ93819.1 phosphoenolpyruvate carboxykinase (ATP) [Candidatus Thiothrix moscowensis]
MNTTATLAQHLASTLGIQNLKNIYWNQSSPVLYEQALNRQEGKISTDGVFVAYTGTFTGRAPNDKFTVDDAGSHDKVWWGKVNKAISEEHFDKILADATAFLANKEVFVQDLLAGASETDELPVRIVTQYAWHALFARNMFIRPDDLGRKLDITEPQFTVIHVPDMQADPAIHGTNSTAFILVNLSRGLVLIGGTHYAGEIKKSIFSVLNYLLPQRGIMSMHASANVGQAGDVAILFGLSGTGKTTLSADPNRALIGDDEHGWSDDGVFNLEGGCYAKVINLSPEQEPLIYKTTQTFGTVLENVVMNEDTRQLLLDDNSITENTRASYPITQIPGSLYPGKAGHPKHIIMLTCDAFGVLPPISKLTTEQAMYHFISGYTAKVAGTEKGVTEPTATFSTCFGAPFMALHPSVYADLLGKKINEHGVSCWLVNTGWTGGGYGVGKRMNIHHTRSMVNAALNGDLDNVETRTDPVFGLNIPVACPGVPADVLDPSSTWTDKQAYTDKASRLAMSFHQNFAQYSEGVADSIREAAPLVGRD